MHDAPHPLAGQTVQLGDAAADPTREGVIVPGAEFLIEDWWDRIAGVSWMDAEGNPAALKYAMRIGLRGVGVVPLDDEVLYGKIGNRGHLVHAAELPPTGVRSCWVCGCTDERACADGCSWVSSSPLDLNFELCTACIQYARSDR